jgi:hypothetical protein
MDMGMGYLETQYHLGNLLTGEGGLHSLGHMFGKYLITGYLIVIHVVDIIYFATGNHEGVTLHQRIDVEECIELLVLGTLVAGNLTSSNLTENIHIILL